MFLKTKQWGKVEFSMVVLEFYELQMAYQMCGSSLRLFVPWFSQVSKIRSY